MHIDLPILIELIGGNGDDKIDEKHYRLRPLLFDEPSVRNKSLELALHDLSNALHVSFKKILVNKDFEELRRRVFAPEANLHRVEVPVELRRHVPKVFLPIAAFEIEDRHIAFCPLIDHPWFEYDKSENFLLRAREVFRRHFRQVEKEQGKAELEELLAPFVQSRHFRLSWHGCWVNTAREFKEVNPSGGDRWQDLVRSGREQIEEVGTCLNKLYPKKLDRALHREALVERVFRAIRNPQAQAIMLLGPPKVGKTAIVHAVVTRMVEEIKRPQHEPYYHTMWQLTPGRLISGMSMSGQWETRINAIFAFAEERKATLNFTQMLALLQTGKSEQGNLSMADLLLTALRRRRFRVLCEMTEEQLRVLRERNRALADQFEIIPVTEPPLEDTLRILLHAARELEWEWKCEFEPDVIPLVIDVTRQFENAAAMPGKAVQWLANLAMQHQEENVTRDDFLEAFHEKSGLELSFFRTEKDDLSPLVSRKERFDPKKIEAKFHRRIIGQQRAVEELRNVVLLAESLLSDPERPIASLFFLGPSGVGKTECAKELARHFFGSEERLLRFDANELCTAAAVSRLVGAYQGGEGTLTGPIRRQPFSVLLFDEIEKAHPDLFDLLLQVIGEARLTDTLGRVASFEQAIVIFTSNLGTREAASRIGFGEGDRENVHGSDFHYTKAVTDFFRPEFINRIDRIVPFGFLNDEELRLVGERMLSEILAREGLRTRKTCLLMTPEARRFVTTRSGDRLYGARGIRRLMEKELLAPISRFLVRSSSTLPSIIEVSLRDNKIHIQSAQLQLAEPENALGKSATLCVNELSRRKRLELFHVSKTLLANLDEQIQTLRPQGRFDAAALTALGSAEKLYFRLNEERQELKRELLELTDDEELNRHRVAPNQPIRNKPINAIVTFQNDFEFRRFPMGIFWRRLAADADLQAAIDELFSSATEQETVSRIEKFLKRISELDRAVRAAKSPLGEVGLLTLQADSVTKSEDGEAKVHDPKLFGGHLLHDSWETRLRIFPLPQNVPGIHDENGTFALRTYRGHGVTEFWKSRQGTQLIFHPDRISVEALLVFESNNNGNDYPALVSERLGDADSKWPPVTSVARMIQGMKQETTLATAREFTLPKPLRDVLESDS